MMIDSFDVKIILVANFKKLSPGKKNVFFEIQILFFSNNKKFKHFLGSNFGCSTILFVSFIFKQISS